MNEMRLTRTEFLFGVAASLGSWRLWADANGLPSYYGEYLAGVAAKVKRLAGEGSDGFWFITDPHVKSNHCMSGRLIAELVRRTGVRRVLCGGDFVDAFGRKEAIDSAIALFREKWVSPIREAGGLLYTAKGNHDFTIRHSMNPKDGDRGFTYPGLVARRILVGEWTEKGAVANSDDPSGCYFYFDEPDSRIRYVVADTCDTEKAEDVAWGVMPGIHGRQLEWLSRMAFGTLPDGWSAVVMHHIPVTGVVGTDSEEKTYSSFRDLLDKYHDRILLDLTGHHHCEMQTCQHGVWHVTNPCDAAYGDYINRSKPWCPNLPVKKVGTVFEQTFDAVQVDRNRSRIYLTRIGGGGDRILHRHPVRLAIGQEQRYVSSLDGEVVWGCYDADRVDNIPDPSNRWGKLAVYHSDVATITPSGVLKGLKKGESVVVALAKNGDKELWSVVVS